MGTLMSFNEGDEVVLVDVTPQGGGVQAVGALDVVVKAAETSFDRALRMAGTVARSFRQVMEDHELDQAELEIGLQFTGKGTVYLVQSQAQAALKIKVMLKRQRRSSQEERHEEPSQGLSADGGRRS